MSVSRSLAVKFSSGDIREWFLRFEICNETNKWSKEKCHSSCLNYWKVRLLIATWVELSEDVQEN